MSALVGIRPDHEFESIVDRNNLIGEGTERRVYAVVDSGDVVVKESKGPLHHSNFVEWIVWNALKRMEDPITDNEPNAELQNLFSPCHSISHSGRFLMMERLQKLEASDKVPLAHLPTWLNDRKPTAFGRTGKGVVKVIDYGMINFYQVLNPKNINTDLMI